MPTSLALSCAAVKSSVSCLAADPVGFRVRDESPAQRRPREGPRAGLSHGKVEEPTPPRTVAASRPL